jgi:hypothetical protein
MGRSVSQRAMHGTVTATGYRTQKEAAMAVLMILDFEGVTSAQYDEVDEILGGMSLENAPAGLISHTAGVTDTGLFVADVWESPEDIQRFYEAQLGAALQQAGVPQTEPRILPVHNHLHGNGADAAVLVIVEIDGMSTDDYDALTGDIDAHAGDGSGHPSVSHIAAVTDDGLVAVDIWGSEEEFAKFGQEELAPRVGDKMGQMKPRFSKVHNHVPVKSPSTH